MRKTLSLLLFYCVISSAGADEPIQQTVFQSGKDDYHTFRIPSLLTTKKGTLLAFCEGRKNSTSDTGDIDLVLKRSTDTGKTWQPLQVVWDDAKNTCGNPCPVVDQKTGVIWLLLTHNLGTDNERTIVAQTGKGSRTVWIAKSDDDGLTWSKPRDITADTKKSDWTWYATGPGVGIQLKSGRLIVPCDAKVAKTNEKVSHVIYSDDAGKTWKIGGVVGPSCNESQIAELSNGDLHFNIRSYRGKNRRLVAISKDGGLTFAKPAEDETLIEPVCQASVVSISGMKGGLLFSNPASKKREKMTVRLSRDDGKTWPISQTLHEGPAAYSCLSILPDGSFACLYERGEKNAYETITFTSFSRTWLEETRK